MGIAHVKNQFSVNQVNTATAVSTNVIDTGYEKVGDVNPVDLEVIVTANFAGGTSMAVEIRDCDTEGGTYLMKQASQVIPVASLVKSEKPLIKMALPNGLRRYLQLNYVIVGTMSGGGAVTSQLVDRVR